MSTPAALLRSHDHLVAAKAAGRKKRGRPKGVKNLPKPEVLPINLDAVAAERLKILEEAKQQSRNRSLGWEQRREARRLASRLRTADWQAKRKAEAGANLCRCLNPECLVWFASWRKANHCSPECGAVVRGFRLTFGLKSPKPLKSLRDAAAAASKRNAGIFETPVLTPYAKCLVATAGQGEAPGLDAILHAATMAAESRTRGLSSGIADGTRERRFRRQEDGDTFDDFYLLGNSLAANYPYRPCDHSGLRSCHSRVKRYNTTTTP